MKPTEFIHVMIFELTDGMDYSSDDVDADKRGSIFPLLCMSPK